MEGILNVFMKKNTAEISLSERLLKSFPPPSFLDLAATGVDISHSGVKVLGLKKVREGYIPDFIEEKRLMAGVVENGEVQDPAALIAVLAALREKYNMHFIRASLPEEKAYLFQTSVPQADSEKQIRSSIEFQLEEHVPITPQDAIFDYDVVHEQKENIEISVTVFSKQFILGYQDILRKSGLFPVSFELEGQAIANAVIPHGDNKTYLIVDFGRTRSSITIVKNRIVGFTSTVNVGGNEMTEAIMKYFQVDEIEAEKIKNTKGFVDTEQNKELHDSLISTVSVLRDEISRHVAYWNNKEENRKDENQVHTIILCGGNASLKGLPEYISSGVKVSVERANVWQNVISYEAYIPQIQEERALSYATAIGLALM